MQVMQNIGELRTHDETPIVDDLPKALEFYGARIGRDLGRLHELTDGKVTIGFIVEMASMYEHLSKTPEDTPTVSPSEFFEQELIPYMEKVELEVITGEIGDVQVDDEKEA